MSPRSSVWRQRVDVWGEQLPGGVGVAAPSAEARQDGMRPRANGRVEYAQPLPIAAFVLVYEVEGVSDEGHEEPCICGVTFPVPAVDLVRGCLEDEGSQEAGHGQRRRCGRPWRQ